jgi:outer membrane protein OmpA-like peptidoglycan-associated protein
LTRTGSKVDVNYTKDGESKSISVPQVSGEIIDNGFALNAKSMIDYVDEIDNEGDDVPDWGVAGGFYTQIQKDYKPSVQGTFQFLAITPTGFRLKNEGQPQVFTAKVLVNKVDFWESQGKTETTEDMVISPTTYQRVGKFGKRNKLAYALKFYDSPNAAYMDELGSDEGGGENVEPIRINVNLTVTDPFKFDKTEFYPETEESLKNFVNEMNGHINNPQYGQKFKEFLSQNPIKVYAYASIDAKSDEISQGRLPSCQNSKQTKAQYNLCLSQARADVVKKYLEDNLEGITVNAIGKGETDKFAPGKKFPNSNTEETKPNRAVVITLPEFRTTIE